MRLRLTERWPTLTDAYAVTDDAGNRVYELRERALGLRETYDIRDAAGAVVGELRAGWLRGAWCVTLPGWETADVTGGRRPRIELESGRRVEVRGRVAGREYTLTLDGASLATASRKALSLTDAYAVDVADPAQALLVVALVAALHLLTQA